jgi:hypothetical protein
MSRLQMALEEIGGLMVGIKIDLRINGKPVRIESKADIRKLSVYLDDLLIWMEQAPKIVGDAPPNPYDAEKSVSGNPFELPPTNNKTKQHGRNPEKGERTIDYIVRALQVRESLPLSMRSETTIDDLYPSIITLGWKGSGDPEKAKRVLIVTARQNKELVSVIRGRLLLTDKGQQHLKGNDDNDPF